MEIPESFCNYFSFLKTFFLLFVAVAVAALKNAIKSS